MFPLPFACRIRGAAARTWRGRSIGSLVRWLGVALLAPSWTAAQPLRLTRADGLPSDYVQAVYQDRAGFLWVGTDAGIARLDGRRVETFTADDGLPHDYVYGIAEDDGGVLWASTFRGLARFDGRRWHADGPKSLGGPLPQTPAGLVVVEAGAVWLRTGGVWRRHPLAVPAPLPGHHRPWPLADGSVLAGDVRLFRARPPERTSVACAPDVPGVVAGIVPGRGGAAAPCHGHAAPLPGGEAWASVDAGWLRRMRVEAAPGGLRQRQTAAMRIPAEASRILGRAGDVVFLATLSRSAVLFLADTRTRTVSTRTLPASPEAIWVDYEGTIWAATFGGGLVRVALSEPTRLAEGAFVRLADGPGGGLYASGPGLWRTDAAATRAARIDAAPQARALATLAVGGLGGGRGTEVLVSVAAHVRRLRGGVLGVAAILTEPSWLSGLDVRGDTLIASTYGAGVLRLVPWQRPGGRLNRLAGLPTPVVEDLVRLPSGLWALTRSHGAVRLGTSSDGPGERRGRAEGLPSSSVFALVERADGSRWYGTERGVAREGPDGRIETLGAAAMRGQRIVAFAEAESLGDRTSGAGAPAAGAPVTGSAGRGQAAGEPGDLWAIGERDLFRIDRAGRVVRAAALLPGTRATVNAARIVGGRLVLASTDGLYARDLPRAAGPLPPPRVALREVRLDDVPVGLDAGSAGEQTLPRPGPGRHRLDVRVAPLSFAGAARAEYRIEDGPWLDAGPEAHIVLPEIGAGRHRLSVRAVNAEGTPSSAPAVLRVDVPPHWWQRRAVWVLALVAALTAAAFAARWATTRRLRARLARLEAGRRVAGERERISRDLHDHVGGQLTTLASLADLARMLHDRGETSRAAASLDTLGAEARQALRQLRQTVFTLRHEAVTPTALVEQLTAQAEGQVQAVEGVALEVDGGADSAADGTAALLPAAVVLPVLRVAQEAVTNALKHARASRISITIDVTPARLVLCVADDGAGMPQTGAVLDGSGLVIMRARAADLGGTLAIERAPGGGTAVTLSVPLSTSPAVPPEAAVTG